jgi:NADPH:quinone reductase
LSAYAPRKRAAAHERTFGARLRAPVRATKIERNRFSTNSQRALRVSLKTRMRAAWYEKQGPAREVLKIGEMPDPMPGPGEVRIRVAASGVNPGDIKKRQNAFGYRMPYPRVIPHSDGAGVVDLVGDGVATASIGDRVWCYGAQSYRPFGTAAEYAVVPAAQAVRLPNGVSFEQGACLGIPGITAHRCVHVAGAVNGRTVLVQGGGGAVGLSAVQLARRAGAVVIATVRSSADESIAYGAGADQVLRVGPDLAERVRAAAPDGIHHIVEVAFGANIATDLDLLAVHGSVAAYATDVETPAIPFWPLLFKNIRVDFVGSDDFKPSEKAEAARAVNEALVAGWAGFPIAERLPLEEIATAHERLEAPRQRGRIVLLL